MGAADKGRSGGVRGFTSVEMIISIVLLGILCAAVIVKNPFSISDYSPIAADQLVADIQYVQVRSMGTGKSYRIAFVYDSSTYSIQDSLGNTLETKRLPNDVKIASSSLTLSFNTLGEPMTSCASGCSVRLTGNFTVMVYGITGKACKFDTVYNKCLE